MDFRFHIDASAQMPIYLQLKGQVKAQIVEGKLPPGTPLPNLKELASLAGVSLRTADMGINELIREGVCYRRPKKGTFVGGEGALAPRGRRKALAVCYGTRTGAVEHDEVAMAMMKGIGDKAEDCGLDVVTLSGTDMGKALEFYRSSGELSLQGVLMLRWEGFKDAFSIAGGFKPLPFVFLNYYSRSFDERPDNVCGIFNDDFAGAYQMAGYVADRRRAAGPVGILSLEIEDENYDNRVRGYLAALDERGVKVPPERILSLTREDGQTLQEAGAILADKLLDKAPDCKTAFCVNDLLACGVLSRMKSRGVVDAFVAGYDNIQPDVSRDAGFPTCAIDFEAMGSKAVELLANPKREYPRTIRLLPQLIARG